MTVQEPGSGQCTIRKRKDGSDGVAAGCREPLRDGVAILRSRVILVGDDYHATLFALNIIRRERGGSALKAPPKKET
jgi:hypothetical protein